ncbi:MAG: hydrogenase assembly protein HupF [Ilumatobacteraceae bacterium]
MASIAHDLQDGNTAAMCAPDAVGDALSIASLSLARRFADGATMWCTSPEWPEHSRHVAVEFVHPVVVGKRALPAVSVDSVDPVGSLRSLVRAGDIVLVISRSDAVPAIDVMRRSRAWGATTVWMGVGPRPPDRAADHIVWAADSDGGDSPALYDGRLVLLYHVLWELTHVCFEHPGLLSPDPQDCDEEVCITCSDEGRLGEVVTTHERGLTTVRTARGLETIDTTMVAGVGPGDLVLIHAGAAIAEVP